MTTVGLAGETESEEHVFEYDDSTSDREHFWFFCNSIAMPRRAAQLTEDVPGRQDTIQAQVAASGVCDRKRGGVGGGGGGEG